jgi:hypothetical protein
MFRREVNKDGVTTANIAVGIASYNEADAIGYPTQQGSLGLVKYFPGMKPVIMCCDNCSPDGTEEAFLETKTEVPKIYITTPKDVVGKGYNFENMFRKALELGVEILICVDADLESITPEWIKHFGESIRSGYDYSTPIYARHKYDGTITNNICFPLVYGVLGRNVRQPIGGDFALSKALISFLIKQPWHRTTEEYGIDIFMTMNAVLGDFRICQTGLGAKIHKPSAPKLGPMFVQVVSTAFLMINKHAEKWRNVKAVQDSPLLGLKELDKPQDLTVDRDSIKKKAISGFDSSRDALKQHLCPDTFKAADKIFSSNDFDALGPELWAKIVYEMIAAFRKAKDTSKVAESLKGLYFARVLSFMNKTWEQSTTEAEKEILAQADCFFDHRDYLLKLVSKK